MSLLPSLNGHSARRCGGRSSRRRGCATLALGLLPIVMPAARAQQPAGPAGATAEKRADVETREAKDAARNALVDQAIPSFRSLFVAELGFIRVATGASEEQIRRMARAARNPLRSMVAGYVETQGKLRRHEPGVVDFDWNAAVVSLRRDLSAIAREQLSAEQWARLQDQAARRDAYARRLFVRNLVVKLDQALVLTADQLDQIAASMSSHWDAHWGGEEVLFNAGLFPDIPDAIVVPFLTETQKAAWKTLEKQAVGSKRGGTSCAMLAAEVAGLSALGAPPGDDLEAAVTAAWGRVPKR